MSADILVPEPNNTQSYNRYSYVHNRPLFSTDPTGFENNDNEDQCGGTICTVVESTEAFADRAVANQEARDTRAKFEQAFADNPSLIDTFNSVYKETYDSALQVLAADEVSSKASNSEIQHALDSDTNNNEQLASTNGGTVSSPFRRINYKKKVRSGRQAEK